MAEAIRLSEEAVKNGNEPFGAVLVKDNQIVYSNENQIYTKTDSTFHSEAGLIRRYCKETKITDLSETLFSSAEPCFILVWVNLDTLVYGLVILNYVRYLVLKVATVLNLYLRTLLISQLCEKGF